MEHGRGALHDRLHGGEVGDVAGHRLDPRIVEAGAARHADVEQQQLGHLLLLAVGVRQRALLQDAPRQLLAEEAAAAGDHHLHVRFRPDVFAGRECAQNAADSLCWGRMRVISWNLLRLEGAAVGDVVALLERERPDVLLMQEVTQHMDVLPRRCPATTIACPGPAASTASRSGAGTISRTPHVLPLPASRPARPPAARRSQIVQVGDITFANVHLSHGQLLNRRQLLRIAAALRGKPSAIIGDYNAVGPSLIPGFADVGPREVDAFRRRRRALSPRPLPGAWPRLHLRRHARVRTVGPQADRARPAGRRGAREAPPAAARPPPPGEDPRGVPIVRLGSALGPRRSVALIS